MLKIFKNALLGTSPSVIYGNKIQTKIFEFSDITKEINHGVLALIKIVEHRAIAQNVLGAAVIAIVKHNNTPKAK